MIQFRQSSSSGSSDHASFGTQISHKQGLRNRRFGRSDKNNLKISIVAVFVILSLVLIATFFAYSYISEDRESDSSNGQDDDLDFLANVTRIENPRVLKFGQGSVAHGRDSRYWDKDDRRRDDEYKGDGNHVDKTIGDSHWKLRSDHRSRGLYKEAGREELKLYEVKYEASMKNAGQLRKDNSNERDELSNRAETDSDDDYDDGIDSRDARVSQNDDTRHDNADRSDVANSREGGGVSLDILEAKTKNPDSNGEVEDYDENFTNTFGEGSSQSTDDVKTDSRHASNINSRSSKSSNIGKIPDSRRRAKRRSSCEMKFLNSFAQIVEPLEGRKFSRFSLQYAQVEEMPSGEEHWEPRFSGHQSLQEREESFYARDQKINCGFIKGPKGSPSTGFDLAEDDARFMSSCHIAVSSCIFGTSDNLRTPSDRMVTRMSKKNVCFVMFMDENTLQTLSLEGQKPDQMGFIGLWRIVVVKNLPYTDMRRVGKVPKFLAHRLFPSARYSIWLDSKLRLQRDPILILEYFLWRKGFEYAISNHYDRHCLWEEVAQNKKLNKFNHTIIDQQFAFYKADGMKKFNASDPNKLLPSNVPEGSFIVRAHTPMSNLFSCLWFNEVDRFTPRDQLSFAYTYFKLRRMNPEKPFHLKMFKDCERRAIVKLFHHRSEAKRKIPLRMME